MNNKIVDRKSFIIRQKSMAPFLYPEIIANCDNSDYWHKFSMYNLGKNAEDFVLQAVQDFVYPAKLTPKYLKIAKEHVIFYASNCLDAIMKIVSNDFSIPNPWNNVHLFKFGKIVANIRPIQFLNEEQIEQLNFSHNQLSLNINQLRESKSISKPSTSRNDLQTEPGTEQSLNLEQNNTDEKLLSNLNIFCENELNLEASANHSDMQVGCSVNMEQTSSNHNPTCEEKPMNIYSSSPQRKSFTVFFDTLTSFQVAKIMKECNNSNFWHKFTVGNVGFFGSEFILRTIVDFLYPAKLIPVNYTKETRNFYFWAKDCFDAILKLVANNMYVPATAETSMDLSIMLNHCPLSKLVVDKCNVEPNFESYINELYGNEPSGSQSVGSMQVENSLSVGGSNQKSFGKKQPIKICSAPSKKSFSITLSKLNPKAVTDKIIADCNNSDYCHKFQIVNVRGLKEEVILKNLLDFLYPTKLTVINCVKHPNSISFYAINCLDALVKLVLNKLRVPKGGTKSMRVIIVANFCQLESINESHQNEPIIIKDKPTEDQNVVSTQSLVNAMPDNVNENKSVTKTDGIITDMLVENVWEPPIEESFPITIHQLKSPGLATKVTLNCNNSNYWHKFKIPSAGQYEEDFIVRVIQDYLHPILLIPAYFTKIEERVIFYAFDCLDVMLKLIANNLEIPNPRDIYKPLKFFITPNICPRGILNIEHKNVFLISSDLLSPELTEKIMTNCNNRYYWHKFQIMNAVKYKTELIYNVLSDFFGTIPFERFFYMDVRNDAYFMARNCLEAIMKLVSNNLQIPNPESPAMPLRFQIVGNFCPLEAPTIRQLINIENRISAEKAAEFYRNDNIFNRPYYMAEENSFLINTAQLGPELKSKIIAEVDDSHHFQKFIIKNIRNIPCGPLMDTINNFLHPIPIVPVNYVRKDSNLAFFMATNCIQAILKCVSNNLTVPNPTNFHSPIHVTIVANCCSVNKFDVNLEDNVKQILQKRHNNGTIDLTNFGNSPGLKGPCYLNRPNSLSFLMHLVVNMMPSKIILARNCIRDLSPIPLIAKDTVIRIDLQENQITTFEDLKPLKVFTNLIEINLSGNPICEGLNRTQYVSTLMKIFPNLQVIDDVDLREIDCSWSPKDNFLCSYDAGDLTEQFIEYFFTMYDSDDRSEIFNLYNKKSMFSITCTIIPGNLTSKRANLSYYFSENRNLIRSYRSSLCLINKRLFKGRRNIIRLYRRLPKSYHDPYEIKTNVIHYTDQLAVLVVYGVFREMNQYLGFSRSFVLQHDDQGYTIMNEQLHVYNALDHQVADCYQKPQRIEVTGRPIPFLPQQYRELQNTSRPGSRSENYLRMSPESMDETLAANAMLMEDPSRNRTSRMKERYKRLLEEFHYDLKLTLTNFMERYFNDEIPEEAFLENPNWRSGNKRAVDLPHSDDLISITVQQRGLLSNQSVWQTFMDDALLNKISEIE